MTLGLVAALAGLALLDSTSIGTLFIPIWLMLTPGRLKLSRFAVYLGTITVFYFAVGIVIVLGASQLAGHLDNQVALWIQLVIGVFLFAISFRFDSKKKPNTGKWRSRLDANGSAMALAGVAVLAGVVELATMLPYLGAIGMMSAADLRPAQIGLLLAGYCLVMIVAGAPAARRAARAAGKDRPVPHEDQRLVRRERGECHGLDSRHRRVPGRARCRRPAVPHVNHLVQLAERPGSVFLLHSPG